MNIIKRRDILGLICLILLGARATPALAVELVRDQYRHESALTSVAMAASELQRSFRLSGMDLFMNSFATCVG